MLSHRGRRRTAPRSRDVKPRAYVRLGGSAVSPVASAVALLVEEEGPPVGG